MTRLKVMTIVGTRPELIRLSRVLARLEESTEHILVHTGQNYDYELNEVFFKELRISPPQDYLDAAGETPAETIGNVIARSDALIKKYRPDAVLVLGDTNSCLAAYSAKRNKVPVFHMEAGNRCFDQRVPEEINRKIVDHISDVNLPYSTLAREYLVREGLPPERCIKTGSPMYEVLRYYQSDIERSDVLERLGLEEQKYFVVSAHREENVSDDSKFATLMEMLNQVAETYDIPLIFSTHPRTRQRIESSGIKLHKRISAMKPFGFFDYVFLQQNALAVLSDSGTITEESSILGFNALNIREAHERPEGMEEASVVMSGLKKERVLQSLKLILARPREPQSVVRPVADYSIPNVSEKVVRIILSYVDYINRVIWFKS